MRVVMEGMECRRLLASVGPDAYGYVAQSGALGSYHLNFGAPGVVTLLDGVNDAAAVVPLGTHTFNFYGTSYTANQLFASENGLLTLGSGVTSAANTDLSTGASQAAIAVLWDDWTTTTSGTDAGAANDCVLYQLDEVNHKLIVQWNAVKRVGFEAFGDMTFQAILSLDTGSATGSILLNYEDLSIGHAWFDNGADATEGIKPAGAPALTKLLIAQNSGVSALVQSGVGTTVSFVPSSVTGKAFRDNDGDGSFTSADLALQGAKVYADFNGNGSWDNGEPIATSDILGNYSVGGLSGGTYMLREIAPPGYSCMAAKQVSVPVAGTAGGVNFANVPIAFTGGGSNDSYLLQLDDGGNNYQVFASGLLTATMPAAAVTNLSFSLAGGDDTLTLDYANGNPFPPGGISFDGGGQSSGGADVLVLNGSDANEAFNLAGTALSLTGVEQTTVNGGGGNDQLTLDATFPTALWFDGGTGTDSLTFNGSAADDQMAIATASITTDENTLRFFGVENLILNALDGNDTINLNSVMAGVNVSISGGAGNDTINIGAGTLDAIGGNVSVFGDAGNDALVLNDQLLANDDTYTFNGNTFDRDFFGSLAFYATEAVTLYGSDGNNQVQVTLAGGRGPEGDSGVPLMINAGGGDDDITVIVQQGATEQAPVGITIAGGSGDDFLDIIDERIAKNAPYAVSNGFVSVGFAIGTFSVGFGTVEAVNLTCESGNNNIALSGTTPLVPVTIDGGLGNDTLTVTQSPSSPVEFDGGFGASETSTIQVNAGNFVFSSDAIEGNSHLSISIAPGASAEFDTTQHIDSLFINGTARMAADPRSYLDVGTLSIAPTAKLDLNDSSFVLENPAAAPMYSTIFQWVMQGFSSSPDPTKTGIDSTAGQNSNGSAILALLDNSLVGSTEWPPGSGNTVLPHAILGKYTYFGDTNFDGMITPDDYGALDADLGATAPAGLAFAMADLNFDGIVTPDDYGAIDANLGLGFGHPLSPLAALELISNRDLPA